MTEPVEPPHDVSVPTTRPAKGKWKEPSDSPVASSSAPEELAPQPSFSLADPERVRLNVLPLPADVKTVAKAVEFLSNLVTSHLIRLEDEVITLRSVLSGDRDEEAVLLGSLRRDVDALQASASSCLTSDHAFRAVYDTFGAGRTALNDLAQGLDDVRMDIAGLQHLPWVTTYDPLPPLAPRPTFPAVTADPGLPAPKRSASSGPPDGSASMRAPASDGAGASDAGSPSSPAMSASTAFTAKASVSEALHVRPVGNDMSPREIYDLLVGNSAVQIGSQQVLSVSRVGAGDDTLEVVFTNRGTASRWVSQWLSAACPEVFSGLSVYVRSPARAAPDLSAVFARASWNITGDVPLELRSSTPAAWLSEHDIICLQECNLWPDQELSLPFPDTRYSVVRCLPVASMQQPGGGVVVFVRHGVPLVVCAELSNRVRICSLELFLLVVAYVAPAGSPWLAAAAGPPVKRFCEVVVFNCMNGDLIQACIFAMLTTTRRTAAPLKVTRLTSLPFAVFLCHPVPGPLSAKPVVKGDDEVPLRVDRYR
ncbi:hypothetical protein BV25DRAFT_1922741 [Artomyces pyxidatus]|uniref:Uncharacterized protein n=1 Tax=Artomyces pyxidatus TaxID=48021 RepID=A0ACB8SDX0_9AGAM|nr:hypothetical protein BV25DRAFT_1922741 [Artomyces pyxidatus]